MLRGEHVVLRPVTAEDLPTLYGLSADLDIWEQTSERSPTPVTLEEYLERRRRNSEESGIVEFAAEHDGVLIGRGVLFNEDAFARHAELGVAVAAEHRGKGYGTDIMRTLAEFAFVRRNLRRVHLTVLESNAPALASYRKVGFLEEGRLREHSFVRGRYEATIRMGLLRSEWIARR